MNLRHRRSVFLAILAAIATVLALAACTPAPLPPTPPPPDLVSSLVIASHVGEVTEEVRTAGETIRYRIYYQNNTDKPLPVFIQDQLDEALLDAKPLNDGAYNPRSHTVFWELPQVEPGRLNYVEFLARVGDAGTIQNQAIVQLGDAREVKTNPVLTKVCPPPRLGWIPFVQRAAEDEPPQAALKEQTTTGVMINFDIPGMWVSEREVDGVIFHRLSIPGQAALDEPGKPELPILGQLVEVPLDVDLKVEIYKAKSIPLDCYNVYPAQELWDTDEIPETFTLNGAAYQANTQLPGELATVTAQDVGIMRGHRLVFLKANPIQYNPATREMEAYSQIEVRLNYDHPAQVQPLEARLESGAFEALLEHAVINYLDRDRFPRYDGPEDAQAVDYLILTHGTFYNPSDADNPLVRLRDWKRQKGYRTRVVNIANIPGSQTAADIRSYLEDAYKYWNPPPTYVLLVGDAEFIPTNYQTAHPSHDDTDIGTDLYYATLDGSDYFPDLFIGRLPVDTQAQAKDAIDKILAYEKTPPGNAAFYTDATLIALFEDVTSIPDPGDPPDGNPENGREDRPWIENMEEIRDYLEANNYDTTRVYASSSGWPGDPGSSQPQTYENNDALPDELSVLGNPGLGIPAFGWDGDTNDINNAIANGTFLITYRDHGSRGGWSGWIGFDRGDVDLLSNGGLSPVVISLACQTSWFDNETDDATLGTAMNTESFGEHWIRDANGGAVAFISATRNSQTGPNDFLMFGMHQAIWPDFDPAPPISGYPELPDIATSGLQRMGQVLTFGKVYMANAYPASDSRERHFEMYHLFGDPEMAIWTEQPPRLVVDHPEGIGATGTQDFVVRVTDDNTRDPVRNAMVTLTRLGSTLATGQTNPAGVVRFTLGSIGASDLLLTATALNYVPYEGTIAVESGGAQINRLDPEDGVEGSSLLVGGQDFSANEQVRITFDGQVVDTVTASGGQFGQVGVQDYSVAVPSPQPLGPANLLAQGLGSDRYAVDVFMVRTANPIDLYTYSQWDSSTWTMAGDHPVWNSPDIQVYDGGTPVASNNLVVGHTYTFKANIHNDTDFAAQNVEVTFKWANFGVGQERVWEEADTVKVDVPAHTVAEAQIDWAPPSTGHLCMKIEIYHVEDINEDNNEGQENLHIGPTSSPAEVPFVIYNPTDRPAVVYLEVRQLLTPGEEQEEPLWTIKIMQPDPQLIPVGKAGEAAIIFDPAGADVKPGSTTEFVLTAFVDGEMIGGAQFEIVYKP